jgi:sulfite reductase alpha subunit-like flavoprotein
MKDHQVSILFASETGNAEEAAFKVREAISSRLGVPVSFGDLQDYDPVRLEEEKTVVFVTSTTGDGEPPAVMKKFWKFLLKRGLSTEYLSKVRHAVFGLGDSAYEKYNAVARYDKLNSLLSLT